MFPTSKFSSIFIFKSINENLLSGTSNKLNTSTKDFYFFKYHTEKSVVSFNSKGYDSDTRIEPQQFLLRTFSVMHAQSSG